MKFDLSSSEVELLEKKGISLDVNLEYTEDEAIDLLEAVRDIEISYSQFSTSSEKSLYAQYAHLADKIFAQIPE